MNIAQHVETGRQQFPTRTALIFEDRIFTYSELDALASRAGQLLLDLGIERGDRVALFLPNIPEFVVAYLGILKIGAIAVSVNARYRRDEVMHILADSGARVVVTTAALRGEIDSDALEALDYLFIAEGDPGADLPWHALCMRALGGVNAVDLPPDAPAAIVYTSGTTGRAKGAVLSHRNVTTNMAAKQLYLQIQPTDRLLLFLPLFHCFGQNAVLNAGLHSGATLVLQRRFDRERTLAQIRQHRVTMFFAIPAIYILLLDKADPAAFGSVRYFFSAAAPMPLEIEIRWAERYQRPIHQGYGLTETSPFASYNHLDQYRSGSIGTPIQGVSMKVVDVETGRDVAPHEPGEIVIRGSNVMLGYWNRPAETAAAMRDGWFHTGDIGYRDEAGYFFLVDRLKDMINVGGLKVYPAEVENILYQHPAVAEAAVFGVPDAVMGERVKAHVVLKPHQPADEQALIDFCSARIADFKVPAAIEFVAEIPKSPTGKILKTVLRGHASEPALSAPPGQRAPGENGEAARTPTLHEIEAWLVAHVARDLGVPTGAIDVERPFMEYGLTSIMAVRLMAEVSQWLGRSQSAVLAWRYPTVRALARHLAGVADSSTPPQPSTPSPPAELDALSDAELAALLQQEITANRKRR